MHPFDVSPALSPLLQTRWPAGCFLDLQSNFQPRGLCISCFLFLKHTLFGWTCPVLPLGFCSNVILYKIVSPVALVTSHMSYALFPCWCMLQAQRLWFSPTLPSTQNHSVNEFMRGTKTVNILWQKHIPLGIHSIWYYSKGSLFPPKMYFATNFLNEFHIVVVV